MPAPGGSADKIGNRYEVWWTVLQLADILNENIDSIWLEPLGLEGEGIEFRLLRNGNYDYHQVKRQQSDRTNWSLNNLRSNGVLSAFINKLSESSSRCTFVSTQDAIELHELSDRARQSSSPEDFRKNLTSEKLRKAFAALKLHWEHDADEKTLSALQRIYIEIQGENGLRNHARTKLEFAIDGDPVQVGNDLFTWALDQIHKEITATDIWNHLEEHGYRRRFIANDPRTITAIDECNKRYTQPIRDQAADHLAIPRQEVSDTYSYIASEPGTNLLIVGEAGIGKSTVIVELMDQLRRTNIPMLAFRVDVLETTHTPTLLGRNLGLQGSPAATLASIAKGKTCVLIIDQLDALSTSSGRNTKFYECINLVIEEALTFPNVRVIIACRKFDLENDSRFRKISKKSGAKEIKIGRLSDGDLDKAVTQLSIEPNTLSRSQRDLLALPLHLSLLSQLLDGKPGTPLRFDTANDLFELFWKFKSQNARERSHRSIRWDEAIETLAQWLSDQQRLSAPIHVLSSYDADDTRAVLESEHIIIRDRNSYRFFHESFFDYAFARSFVNAGGKIEDVLAHDAQDLFRRSQIRQILQYRRASGDHEAYLRDINALLLDTDIRYHIKRLALTLLGNLQDPMEDEWAILHPLLTDSSLGFKREAQQAIIRSSAWLQFADDHGFIEHLLNSADPLDIDFGLRFLSLGGRNNFDRVTRLLHPLVGRSSDWNARIRFVTGATQDTPSAEWFDLVLEAINAGAFDSKGRFTLEDTLEDAPSEWQCQAIATAIAHVSASIQTKDITSGTIFETYGDGSTLASTASESPESFVKAILPEILILVEKLGNAAHSDGGSAPGDDVFGRFLAFQDRSSFRDCLLDALRSALSSCTQHDPEEFRSIVTALLGRQELALQLLALYAISVTPAYADLACEYLCSNDDLLQVGYTDSSRYVSRLAIERASMHCSQESLTRLEARLLAYYPPYEMSKDGYMSKSHGRAQYILLQGIEESRRSNTTKQRLRELERKFHKITITPVPRGAMAGFVQSPIPTESASKMTDSQWILAIAAHNSSRPSGGFRSNWLKGGAHQLSQVLENQTKADPDRFIGIGLRLPNDTNPSYFEAILRGLKDSHSPLNLVQDFILKCHSLPDRPCGRWIGSPVSQRGDEDIPIGILDILEWYAENDPDPSQELWKLDEVTGRQYYAGDVFSAGLNSARGSACFTLASITNEARAERYLPLLSHLVNDPIISVRSCVAAVLVEVLRSNREPAVRLFLRLCETEDALLSSDYCQEFIRRSIHSHYEALRPILERMLRSNLSDVRQAGARQATLASLTLSEALPLAELSISGDDGQRSGAAEVYSINLGVAEVRRNCIPGLATLFNDNSTDVRTISARCFSSIGDTNLAEFEPLISAFIDSPAFVDEPTYLLDAIEEPTSPVADISDIACRVCERFVAVFGTAIGDIQTRAAGDAYMIRTIVLRVYSQTTIPAIRSRCLDIIDGLYKYDALSIESVLDDFER